MSEQVVVGDITYLSSSLVASKFGYSLDYVSRLAREGRVEATRVGKKWFVEPSSVGRFIEESKLKKAKVSAELSATRKRELKNGESSNAVFFERSELRPRKNIALALAGSSMVMVAGLFAGVLYNPHITIFSEWNSSTIQLGAPQVVVSTDEKLVEQAKNINYFDSRFVSNSPTAGMVVFSGTTTADTEKKVKRSFSDEVKIQFMSSSTGRVTPLFRGGKSEGEYNFVVVPLKEAS